MNPNESVEIEVTPRIGSAPPSALIIGGGIPAMVAAEALAAMGVDITFARFRKTPDHVYFTQQDPSTDDKLEELALRLGDVKTVDVYRAPVISRDRSGFKARFEDGTTRSYDCLLLAPGLSLSLPHSSLPQNAELFSSHTKVFPGERVAFLMDYLRPSDPALGMNAIKAAAHNVINGGSSVVFFRNLPVLHLFGEALCDWAREVGVQFVRFGDEEPLASSLGEHESPVRFRLTARDMIDPDSEISFDCTRLVSVTGPDASQIPEWALEIARDDLDDRGFVLSESVHCNSGSSFATGVYLVGEATGNLDLIGGIAQAKAAAAKAQAWIRTSRFKMERQSISVNSACVGCLTCYRICPHGAISVKPGTSRPPVEAWPSLCRECGICASTCPSVAIHLMSHSDDSLLASIREVPQADMERTTFLFVCRRSAGLLEQKVEIPENVRFAVVPCAGRVSEYVIWYAFAAGARGVLVAGCHSGNCASSTGANLAGSRVRRGLATGLLQEEPERLRFVSVAPNEPARLQRLLTEFAGFDPMKVLEKSNR
ncbi:MAG TPA: hydrogenase iron-sulfur subunit [Desulfomonilaceae bacterium]|nr:hydrogenase iron-sulfur subunit [Desulfomonilaceae bacterium]